MSPHDLAEQVAAYPGSSATAPREEGVHEQYVVRGGQWVAAMAGALLLGGPVGADGDDGRPFRLDLSGSNGFSAFGDPINPHGDADRGRSS